MKCPLLRMMRELPLGGIEEEEGECLKEECAWWEKEGEGCAILLVGLRLGTVCDQLIELLDKMPHEEQFRE